jgi:hypothetical protein
MTPELVAGLFVTVSAGGLLLVSPDAPGLDGCSLAGGLAGLD